MAKDIEQEIEELRLKMLDHLDDFSVDLFREGKRIALRVRELERMLIGSTHFHNEVVYNSEKRDLSTLKVVDKSPE